MKRMDKLERRPRVALLVETSSAYGRELLAGIAQFVHIHSSWSIGFEEGDPRTQIPEWFDRRQWDGIIARLKTTTVAQAVCGRGMPVVDVSNVIPMAGIARIRSDDLAVGRIAAEHLIERGFRHFAFCGYTGMDWSDKRKDGFVQRLAKAGFSCQVFEHAPVSTRAQRSFGRELQRWLQCLPRPAGLMACNDALGRQTLNSCRDAQIPVPDQVAVIGADNDELLCKLSDIPLSSVILNAQRIGFEAAALLDQLMAGKRVDPHPILIQPVGVAPRQSTDVLAMEDAHVASALRAIREHACDGMDVPSLLKVVPLSRCVLEKRFVKSLGRTPHAEIIRVRLERVCQLLSQSDLPLAEVAEKAGFEYAEYMSRLFKNKMGMTPMEFRKRCAASGGATDHDRPKFS